MTLPEYDGGSIVNLMAAIAASFGPRREAAPAPSGSHHYRPLQLLADDPLPRDGHIVLLVVDGLGHDYLQRSKGAEVLRGGLRGAMTSVFPSTTATAVTAFLTGVPAQQHGLTGWHIELAEVGQSAAILPFETRAGGVPLRSLGVDPAALFDYPTFFQQIDAECFAVSPDAIARSVFNQWHTRGAAVQPYRSLSQCFEAIERLTREPQRRRYIYAYLPDFDTCAHEYGVASPLAAAWLQRFAQAFERLLRALSGSGTTVLVTADHGFVDVPAAQRLELGDHPRLAQCLTAPLSGERRLPYCRVAPAMRAQFEDYIGDDLAQACTATPSEQLVAAHRFGLGAAHPALADRVGNYTLIMRPGYSLKDWLPEERRHTLVGVHGGVTADEMQVPLLRFQS